MVTNHFVVEVSINVLTCVCSCSVPGGLWQSAEVRTYTMTYDVGVPAT